MLLIDMVPTQKLPDFETPSQKSTSANINSTETNISTHPLQTPPAWKLPVTSRGGKESAMKLDTVTSPRKMLQVSVKFNGVVSTF